MPILWPVLKKKNNKVSILRMKVIWINALSVCTGFIQASVTRLQEGSSEKQCRQEGIHVCTQEGRERFSSTYCVPDPVPLQFPVMSQESCSHPIFIDDKPVTLIEEQAKVSQRMNSGCKIQPLVSLQHTSFFYYTRPDSCYCFNDY